MARSEPNPTPPGSLQPSRSASPAVRTPAVRGGDPSDQLATIAQDEQAALTASGWSEGYTKALAYVCLSMGLTPPKSTVLAIKYRLCAHGIGPEQAMAIARALVDDPDFDDKVKRYRGEMSPADWLRVWALFPTPRALYTGAEADDLARRLRLDRSHFRQVRPDADLPRVLRYLPPSDPE